MIPLNARATARRDDLERRLRRLEDADRFRYVRAQSPVTTTTTFTAAEADFGSGATAGRLYYYDADTATWTDANADDTATASGVFLCTAVADGSATLVRAADEVTGLSGLTAGAVYYLADSTNVPSTDPGTHILPVFYALSTTTATVNIPIVPEVEGPLEDAISLNASGATSATLTFQPGAIEDRCPDVLDLYLHGHASDDQTQSHEDGEQHESFWIAIAITRGGRAGKGTVLSSCSRRKGNWTAQIAWSFFQLEWAEFTNDLGGTDPAVAKVDFESERTSLTGSYSATARTFTPNRPDLVSTVKLTVDDGDASNPPKCEVTITATGTAVCEASGVLRYTAR